MRALLSASAILAGVAGAQSPLADRSPWADLSVPGGTAQATVLALGKLVVCAVASAIHVYSAFTREWSSRPMPQGAPIRQANDWVAFREPGAMVAFSSMSGRFESIPISASAVEVNPVSQRNDSLLVVRDGSRLLVFNGLSGDWTARAIGPGASVAVERHVALLADGSCLSGFSAYDGSWHDLAITGPVLSLSADGTAGVAEQVGLVHGFSAETGTWASSPALAGPASFVRDDDWAIWSDGSFALAFSGLRGSFAMVPAGTPSETVPRPDLCVLRDGNHAVLYSAITNSFAQHPLSQSGSILAGDAVAMLVDGTTLVGFSAVRGTATPLALDSGGEAVSSCVGAAVERTGGRPFLFSSLTAAWHAAPNGASPGLPRLAAQSALLSAPSGHFAFSARSGRFLSVQDQAGNEVVNPSSSILMLHDASDLFLFEPRSERWIRRPRSSTGPATAHVWRTSALFLDGNEAVGFGSRAGIPDSISLAEPPASYGSNSECSRVVTATHVYAFGAVPLVCPLHQFPEFRRVALAGSPVTFDVRVRSGEAALLAIGFLASSPIPLGALGELLVNPAPAAILLVTPDPGKDRARLRFPTPAAGLGIEWGCQALFLGAGLSPALGDLGSVMTL
ncbi:MAG: hypothetical protein Fur0037_05090 [Planctomycetota bacterium]